MLITERERRLLARRRAGNRSFTGVDLSDTSGGMVEVTVTRGERLKLLRMRKRIPMHIAAERAGVSRMSYWKWENGRSWQPKADAELERLTA